MTDIRRTNWEKANYHLARAETWQARAEEFEAEAARKGADQQVGRMQRADQSTIDLSFVASRLLDTPAYRQVCAIRNAHQAQAQLYILAHQAGLPETGYVLGDGKIGVVIPRQRST